ncbi:hypothetical protein S40293_09923 [Stachybotrys chartarum IBT 40293]|nr:hypothetical protein S40293_09923 [Stachybotrys chartarum IBT 40293]
MAPLTFTSTFAALLLTVTVALAAPPSSGSNATTGATILINSAIQALGGREALTSLQGVTYQAERQAQGHLVFRTRTIMQNYHLLNTDRFIVIGGSQNVSFSYHDKELHQRIDRSYTPSELFVFARPDVPPRDFSLVVHGGDSGFACFVQGNYLIFRPAEDVAGYLDSAITDYLLTQAQKLSPKLLLEVEAHEPILTNVTFWEKVYPAVRDDENQITVVFDPESHLPFLIRSFEDHPIFGQIPKDLHLINYTEVDGLMFPQSQKIFYKGDAIVEETEITSISVNPIFAEFFFDGLDANETASVPSPPMKVLSYGHGLLGQFWSNMLWGGQYLGTIGDLEASNPADDLPGVHHIALSDGGGIAQLVLELEDYTIVFESPHHQSDLVIQWVSHHHHDHNFDVDKFVALGAAVIVPEMAASYWSQIPNITLITFTEDEPYIISDGSLQARFIWRPDTPHSADFTYAIVTSACPSADSSMLAFTADAYTSLNTGFEVDKGVASQWLLQAIDDGLSRNALVVPAHGTPVPLSEVFGYVGTPYPDLDSTSFIRGGNICLESLTGSPN